MLGPSAFDLPVGDCSHRLPRLRCCSCLPSSSQLPLPGAACLAPQPTNQPPPTQTKQEDYRPQLEELSFLQDAEHNDGRLMLFQLPALLPIAQQVRRAVGLVDQWGCSNGGVGCALAAARPRCCPSRSRCLLHAAPRRCCVLHARTRCRI